MDELEQRYKSLISQQNSEDSDLSDSDEELSPLVMDIAEALKPTIKQRSLNEENSETDTCSGSDENIEISKNDDGFIGGKRTGVDDMKKLKNFVNFYKVTKDFEQKFKKCTKSKHMLHFSMSSLSDVKKAISETDKVSHTRSNALRKWNSEMKLNSCDDLQFNIKDIRHHLLGDDQYQGLEALEFFDEPVISPTKVNMAYCDSYLDESFNANEKDPLSFDSKEDIKSKIDLILKTESPKKGLIKLRKITDLVEEKPLKATTKRLNIPVKFDLKSLKVIGQTKCPQNLVSSPKPIEPLKMAQTNVSSVSKAYKCYSDNDSCINDIAAANDDFNPIIQAAFSLAEKETPPTMNSQKLPTKQIVLKHGQIVNISHGKTNTPVHTDPITNKSNTQNNPFSGIISHTVGEINNFTHETVTTMPSNPRLTYISTRIKSEPSGRDSVPQERAPPNRQQNTNISNANTMPQRTYGNTKSNLNIPVKPVCMTSSLNANTTPPKQLHNINSYILPKPVSIKTSPNATMISKPPILMNTASKSNIFLEGKQTVVSTPDNNKTSPPRRIIQMKENGKLGMFTSVSQILQDQTTAPQPSWFTSFGSGNVLLNVAPQSHSGTLQLSNISAEPTVGYVIVNDLDTPKSVIDKSAVTQTTNGAIIGNIELVKPSKATDNDLKSAKNEVAGSNYQRSKTAENISSVKNKSDILNTQKTHLATVQQQPQFSKVKDFKQDSSGKRKQNQSTESTVRGTQLKFIPITKKSVPTSSTIAKTKILFRKDLLEKDEFTKELFGEVIQESNLILFNNLNKYFCTWCRSGFSKKYLLHQHKYRLTCKMVYECEQCSGKRILFKNRCQLLKHLLVHYKQRHLIAIDYNKLKIFRISMKDSMHYSSQKIKQCVQFYSDDEDEVYSSIFASNKITKKIEKLPNTRVTSKNQDLRLNKDNSTLDLDRNSRSTTAKSIVRTDKRPAVININYKPTINRIKENTLLNIKRNINSIKSHEIVTKSPKSKVYNTNEPSPSIKVGTANNNNKNLRLKINQIKQSLNTQNLLGKSRRPTVISDQKKPRERILELLDKVSKVTNKVINDKDNNYRNKVDTNKKKVGRKRKLPEANDKVGKGAKFCESFVGKEGKTKTPAIIKNSVKSKEMCEKRKLQDICREETNEIASKKAKTEYCGIDSKCGSANDNNTTNEINHNDNETSVAKEGNESEDVKKNSYENAPTGENDVSSDINKNITNNVPSDENEKTDNVRNNSGTIASNESVKMVENEAEYFFKKNSENDAPDKIVEPDNIVRKSDDNVTDKGEDFSNFNSNVPIDEIDNSFNVDRNKDENVPANQANNPVENNESFATNENEETKKTIEETGGGLHTNNNDEVDHEKSTSKCPIIPEVNKSSIENLTMDVNDLLGSTNRLSPRKNDDAEQKENLNEEKDSPVMNSNNDISKKEEQGEKETITSETNLEILGHQVDCDNKNLENETDYNVPLEDLDETAEDCGSNDNAEECIGKTDQSSIVCQ